MRAAYLLGLGYAVSGCGVGNAIDFPLNDAGERPDSGADIDASDDHDAAAGRHDASMQDASIVSDAGEDAGSPAKRFESRRLASAPSYMGSVNNGSACSQSYATQGFEPVPVQGHSERYPLFLYFVGTAFTATDPSAAYDGMAATKVAEAMARRGFVALSADYDHGALAWLSDHVGQLDCLFASSNSASLIAKACALPQVDCTKGIATWGHSMGGYVAVMAYNREPRVRAAWATGYGGDGAATLPKNRLRVVNGEADTSNGTAATLNTITGLTPADCPNRDSCLRADGSGWVIVRASQLALPEVSSADHCWFDKQACSASTITLEPNWISPTSDKPFALEPNADWVGTTTRRP